MIQIDRALLLKACEALAPALETRTTVPVLEHFLLHCSGDRLMLSACDLETDVTATVGPLAGGGEFSATAHGKSLIAALHASPPGRIVQLSLRDGRIELEAPRLKASIYSFPDTDFPKLKGPADDAVPLDIGAADLSMALARVSPAISREETRYYLNGICLGERDGKTEAVATDGHRLAMVTLPVSRSFPPGMRYIVPHRAVRILRHIVNGSCDKERDTVRFRLDGPNNRASVQIGDIQLRVKLIDGKFPDYQRIIPTGAEDPILMCSTAEDMRNALEVVCVGRDRSEWGPLVVDLGSETCSFSSGSESSPAKLTVEFDGVSNVQHRVGLKSSYLSAALATISGPIELRHRPGDSQPLVLTAPRHPSWRHIIMPMRL